MTFTKNGEEDTEHAQKAFTLYKQTVEEKPNEEDNDGVYRETEAEEQNILP